MDFTGKLPKRAVAFHVAFKYCSKLLGNVCYHGGQERIAEAQLSF